MRESKNFKELLADVEAIVFDVDGVMTDGGIMPLADGDFIRKYNAKDGYALAYAVKHNFNIGVISGGFGKTLESRMNRLGIKYQYLGCMDKIAAIDDFIAKTGVKRENIVSRTGAVNGPQNAVLPACRVKNPAAGTYPHLVRSHLPRILRNPARDADDDFVPRPQTERVESADLCR